MSYLGKYVCSEKCGKERFSWPLADKTFRCIHLISQPTKALSFLRRAFDIMEREWSTAK